MNKQNRKDLDNSIESLETIKTQLESLHDDLRDQSESFITADIVARLSINDVKGGSTSTILALLEQAHSEIEGIKDEEQDKFDNMSEGLQQSENGQKLEENVQSLDEALSNLDDIEGLGIWKTHIDSEPDAEDLINELDQAVQDLQTVIDYVQEAINR